MALSGALRRSVAIAVLATSGAVAAFATIAPSADNEVLLSRTSSVETLDIPAEALLPSPESYIREERFQRGDTIAAFLSRLGIAAEHATEAQRQGAGEMPVGLALLRNFERATAEIGVMMVEARRRRLAAYKAAHLIGYYGFEVLGLARRCP